jgi:hypothetical protein
VDERLAHRHPEKENSGLKLSWPKNATLKQNTDSSLTSPIPYGPKSDKGDLMKKRDELEIVDGRGQTG